MKDYYAVFIPRQHTLRDKKEARRLVRLLKTLIA
jgi:hypothetical protein